MTPEERNAWAAYDGHRIDRAELKAVLVRVAVAEERSACARQADLHRDRPHLGHNCLDDDCGPDIAAAIRARG